MSRLLALLQRETALAWGRGGGPLVAVGFTALPDGAHVCREHIQ